MQRRMLVKMRERGERSIRGMQQPERRDVAGTEFDDVLGRLTMKAV
jgi:hypothetical protein